MVVGKGSYCSHQACLCQPSSASPPAPPLLNTLLSPSSPPGMPCCDVKTQVVQPPALPKRKDPAALPLIPSLHLCPLALPWLRDPQPCGSTRFPHPTGFPLVSRHSTYTMDLRTLCYAQSLHSYGYRGFLLPSGSPSVLCLIGFALVLGTMAPPQKLVAVTLLRSPVPVVSLKTISICGVHQHLSSDLGSSLRRLHHGLLSLLSYGSASSGTYHHRRRGLVIVSHPFTTSSFTSKAHTVPPSPLLTSPAVSVSMAF